MRYQTLNNANLKCSMEVVSKPLNPQQLAFVYRKRFFGAEAIDSSLLTLWDNKEGGSVGPSRSHVHFFALSARSLLACETNVHTHVR